MEKIQIVGRPVRSWSRIDAARFAVENERSLDVDDARIGTRRRSRRGRQQSLRWGLGRDDLLDDVVAAITRSSGGGHKDGRLLEEIERDCVFLMRSSTRDERGGRQLDVVDGRVGHLAQFLTGG